jgi:mono/diheme cytochrome c family protein
MKRSITITLLAVFAFTTGALFADGKKVFKRRCGTCHTIEHAGEKLGNGTTGPILTGLASKRPEEYIRLYMKKPDEARKKFSNIYEAEVKGKYTMKMMTVQISDTEINEVFELMK